MVTPQVDDELGTCGFMPLYAQPPFLEASRHREIGDSPGFVQRAGILYPQSAHQAQPPSGESARSRWSREQALDILDPLRIRCDDVSELCWGHI